MEAPRYQFPDDAALAGRSVVVLGLGLYHGGAAVCRFLHRLGCRITVTDLRDAATLAESLSEIADIPCELVLGGHRTSDLDRADFVAVNPAVPGDAPFLVEAVRRGIPLVSEVGLFFSRLRSRFVLVTGSKGKTTTTALLHSMAMGATAGDPRVIVGGNIGAPLLDRVHEIGDDATVIFEISSFQLEQLRGLERSPEVTIVTNVFPVHIDRHGTFEVYKAAKREALSGAKSAILNLDDPESASLAAGSIGSTGSTGSTGSARVSWFTTRSADPGAYHLDSGVLVAPDGAPLLPRSELAIPGQHNVANALAAFAAADRLGVPREAARTAARAFRGVAHRLELVAEHGGVRFVNDSIATTPQSAIAALDALEGGIWLIAGGKDSPFDLEMLSRRITERARGLFAIGETGPLVAAAVRKIDRAFPIEECRTLAVAFAAARSRARAGDVIVLAPAFPSFDQFRNFKERGEAFRRLASGST